ncbi:MAG: hypothetical protein ABIJ46_00610 [bacterium]
MEHSTKWVQVTAPDSDTEGPPTIRVIGLAILGDDGPVTFRGESEIFPPAITNLSGENITPTEGLAYLHALKGELTSAYGLASDVETGLMPEIGQIVETPIDVLAA